PRRDWSSDVCSSDLAVGITRKNRCDHRRTSPVRAAEGVWTAWAILSLPFDRPRRTTASVHVSGDPMPEILTESFCERCGTRYTFEAQVPKKSSLGKFRTLSKGFKNYVLSDETTLEEA